MNSTVFILMTLLGLKVIKAAEELYVQCNDNHNITIHSTNANFSSVSFEKCTDSKADIHNGATVFLHINCSSNVQDRENFTVLTLSELEGNKVENITLAIACGHPTNVYRIADGSEFTSKSMRFEVGDIDMRFKTGLGPYSEDLSTVFLGDQFYMIIQYTGKSNYNIIPRSCVAFQGNIASSSKESVEIWNDTRYIAVLGKKYANCYICVVSVGIPVMENFNYTDDGRLYAKMYGFRFNNEGNNDITIKCDLKLCLPSNSRNSTCGMHICKAPRNRVNMNRIASSNIEIIVDSKTNAACGIVKGSIIIIVIVLVIMTVVRCG